MTSPFAVTLHRQWEALGPRRRAGLVVGLPVALYLLAYFVGPAGGWLAKKAPVGIVTVGVVEGSVTALLAIGLILIYRTNRFINFAYGSMGSLVGVFFLGLFIQHHWPFFLILPLGVVAGGLAGGLIEFLVIRRFFNASRLILTVASIGLAQVLGYLELRGALAVHFTSLTGGFTIPISWRVNLGVVPIRGDQILILIVVPAVISVLAWFLLRTDAGVAVRAAAENSDRALLLGIPIRRLSTLVWVAAGALATLTYILKAPFTGVTPGVLNGPDILLPALAAAVVARMESLPIAFAAGAGLGITEQLVLWNFSKRPALTDVVFFVVVLCALLLQRRRFSRAEEGASSSWSSTATVKPIPIPLRRLPEVRYVKWGLLTAVAALFVFVPHLWGPANQYLAADAMVWSMVGVSLVVLTGWGGDVSLGQFAFVGLGAFTAGNLIQHLHADLFLSLIAAGAAGAAAALFVGLPALRIRGLFLAVTTLAFSIAVDGFVLNPNYFPKQIPSSVKRPLLLERFDLDNNYLLYLVCLVFLAFAVLAAYGVRKARSGRVLIATRDNARASQAAAVPATNVRLSAFILAGIIAGVAGGLHVLLLSSISVGSYSPTASLEVFSTAVIGGLGSLAGAIFGVLVFRYLETVHSLGQLRTAVAGAGLLFVLYFLPGGLWGVVIRGRDRLLRRVADRRHILVPSLVADKRVVAEEERSEELSLLQGALGSDNDGATPTDHPEVREPVS
jgi:branched-chain amino acid transport system permease protein